MCEAVDGVITGVGHNSQSAPRFPKRAFCVVRPPGHHCGEDTPCGFCFVNNVAVAAAHGESHLYHLPPGTHRAFEAHLKHKVQKIVIFDIDLHHGIAFVTLAG